MAGRGRGTGRADDEAPQVELGPFRLVWREERGQWTIAWYDDGGAARTRRVRRKATGVTRRGEDGRPPQEALDALASHYAAWRRPDEDIAEEPLVEGLLADWLEHVDENNADPDRARECVVWWLRFFEVERSSGRLSRGPYLSDVKVVLVERYIRWRLAMPGRRAGSRISGATVSREVAALRAALRRAWKAEVISTVPFVPDVPKKDKAAPRDLVYTVEEVARILDAAVRLEERHHVLLYIIIVLSTIGRGEAVLELDADRQIRSGRIHFLVPGELQTSKRRSIVPIAPTLAPWLQGLTGKVIQYRTRRRDPETGTWVVITKPTKEIRTAFEACLVEAGICEQVVDEKGRPVWLPPRRKLGETERRPKMRGIGNPNTLRHTINTELHVLGVPESQIETAAGHAGEGTNKRNYRHLRPDYLTEFVAGVEAYWRKVGEFTSAHVHPTNRVADSTAHGSGCDKNTDRGGDE